jgi:hypothetical protein
MSETNIIINAQSSTKFVIVRVHLFFGKLAGSELILEASFKIDASSSSEGLQVFGIFMMTQVRCGAGGQ